jgi:hypothetical protein
MVLKILKRDLLKITPHWRPCLWRRVDRSGSWSPLLRLDLMGNGYSRGTMSTFFGLRFFLQWLEHFVGSVVISNVETNKIFRKEFNYL